MRKISILLIVLMAVLAVNMVYAAEPEMHVYVADINSGETAHVQITLPADAEGSVSVSVNGQTKTANLAGGQATIDLTDLKPGDYVVNVTYDGAGNYSKVSKDVNLKVSDNSAPVNNTTTSVNASGEPVTLQNITKVTNNNTGNANDTNKTNHTNTTNKTPAKKPVQPKAPAKPKKDVPKPLETLADKNTGLPILVLILVVIGAVVAVVFRKR